VLQGGFWSDDWPYQEREWDGTFRFVMVGQLHERKDPFAAIEAFAHLKRVHGDAFDAELHLKTTTGGLAPAMEDAYEGLKIHYRYWEQSRLLDLYRRCHVLLAPSRGEGKNVPALEMQATGGAVIATDFGGHRNWLSKEYAYPLQYELEDAGNGLAARADRQHLADLMWHTYTHRNEVREKGRVASRTVRAMYDWIPVSRKLLDVVMAIPPRNIATALG
jgi:glycosyltransferase involved in cell wall biosynthesis